MPGIVFPPNWKKICRQNLRVASESIIKEMDTIGLRDAILVNLRNSFNFKDAHAKPALAFSGGLDSSVLAALMIEQDLPFTAVTIAASEDHPDYQHAMLLNEHFNFPLKVVLIDPDEKPDDMYDLLFSEITELGFGFVIGGDTIDEQLGGYAEHQSTEEMREVVFHKYWDRLFSNHLEPMHKAAHAAKVEVALPYLAAFRFIQNIPLNHRANNFERKIILKNLAERLGIPVEIITRPKFGLCNVLQAEQMTS